VKRALHLLAGVMLASLTAGAVSAAPAADKNGFVSVKSTHFARDGKAYYIAGANLWYGGYLGAPSGVGQRARLSAELDKLKALGINNLRVLAVSEKTEMKSAVSPATTEGPGKYSENLMIGLDFLQSELAKRGMTSVLYLNNFWQWSGGMTQYLNWFEGTPAIDPNVTNDYEDFMKQNARFYINQEAQNAYRTTIRKIVERVNTVTGKAYRDDPSIMAWQLANEPRPGNSKASDIDKARYTAWIDATAGYIHSIDKHHLVSSGSEGLAGSSEDGKLYVAAHATRHIDYLTYHLWPRNWSWFDSARPQETWDNTISKSRTYLNTHIDFAKQLGKPIVLEEFGLTRDGALFDRKTATTQRDRFYAEVFDLLGQRAAAGDPIAGWNFWAWGGAGRAANADFWWKPGNDFVGDPPQEEQGLYSVFDSDASTLALIKDRAARLHALQK
jgi:mannan endo-1,4-beta-mannosidase